MTRRETHRSGETMGDRLSDLVRREAATVAAASSRHIDLDRSWRALGITRDRATDLRERLERGTGLRLPPTVLFDHPTPAELVDHLARELTGEVGEAPGTGGPNPVDATDPIAIIGMACRYPGGVTCPEQLWRLVAESRDAICGLPNGRGWNLHQMYQPDPARSRTTATRGGGFLHDADQFDATFFGIGAREAAAMDPQQRLLLETSWEALERAGIDPCALKGTQTGVYVGIAYRDYGPSWHEPADGYEGHLLTGQLTSVASGRIAYLLGLHGPALTIDTACSSSLVAIHQAAQALRLGECDLALVGGATVMATPGVFLEFSRKHGLAPDGRCKSFSAAADGTGWGEGAGMLVLERLSDARRRRHPVLALIRGCAVNQDGASNGLTAPNGRAQQQVIRQALNNAALTPLDVDVVEAHGTGTVLGDPIEARALAAVYGPNRSAQAPLWLGTIKSNFGHTQAAAGVAGVIKMVQAMRHGVLPQTLHADDPSPHVDWATGGVALLQQARAWPRTDRPRRAAVSAFGVSGTNCHLILEAPPSPADDERHAGDRPMPVDMPVPWVLSARSAVALRGQAERLRGHLNHDAALRTVDVGWSLAGRSRFPHRAVLLAVDRARYLHQLDALIDGHAAAGLVSADAHPDGHGKVAFMFSGQGSQRPGMGRELYDRFPVFAKAFDDTCTRLDVHLARPLRAVVWEPDHAGLLDRTGYTQPALFVLQVALCRLLEAWGIVPDLMLGHSIGELAAAHLAGVLDLDDACTLVAARARLMQACRTGGAMVSIQASEQEIRAALDPVADRAVDVASVNGPEATVISGDQDAVLRVAAAWQANGHRTSRLRVSHAFHSSHMDSMLDEFGRIAAALSYQPAAVPLVSTVTGQIAGPELCSPEYWVRQAREPVRFLDAVRRTRTDGATAFLEVGPDATLTAICRQWPELHQEQPLLLAAGMRARIPEPHQLLNAAAELHVHGAHVNWRAVLDGCGGRSIELPTYAFDRRRYWLDAPGMAQDRTAPATGESAPTRHLREAWVPIEPEPTGEAGRWLIICGRSLRDRRLAERLAAAFGRCGCEANFVILEDLETTRDRLGPRIRQALTDTAADGALSLLGLHDGPDGGTGATPLGLRRNLALAQAWSDVHPQVPLWWLTSGAVAASDREAPANPRQAMIWGLGRCAALELPRHWGGLVDINDDPDESTLDRVCGALSASEDQLAIRPYGVLARRLVPVDVFGTPPPQVWQPRGTILITGGTGAVGSETARWLATHGAQHLVLVSRRGPDSPGAASLRSELRDLGVQVTVAACEVADRDELARLLASIPEPLTAVVHAAGVSGGFVPLADLTDDDLTQVLAAKTAGAAHLHDLLDGKRLDAFVLISSIAGVWGGKDQAGYAAANAYLDALAQHRRGNGQPATAVAFGPWAGQGMAASAADRLRQQGLRHMPPVHATAALWDAVYTGEPSRIVADVDWPRFLSLFAIARPSRLFDRLPEGTATPPPPRPSDPTPRHGHTILDTVRAETADILGFRDGSEIDPARRFFELGFDSLAVVELSTRLSATAGRPVPGAVVFEHDTPTALARYLADGQPTTPTADATKTETSIEDSRLRHFYRKATQLGLIEAGFDLLSAAAQLRPTFDAPETFTAALDLTTLATGSTDPVLVCVPPIVAPCGPHNYAHFAAALDRRRTVVCLPQHPGFGRNQPLPGSRELIVAMLARAVHRHIGDTPFALIGYSSGCWLAHAIASHLPTLDVTPSAVILLDAPQPRRKRMNLKRLQAEVQGLVLTKQAFALMTDEQLTAQAAYANLFRGWQPDKINASLLLVRSAEIPAHWPAVRADQMHLWQTAAGNHTEMMQVPGDHRSIMTNQAASTADVIHHWLLERADAGASISLSCSSSN